MARRNHWWFVAALATLALDAQAQDADLENVLVGGAQQDISVLEGTEGYPTSGRIDHRVVVFSIREKLRDVQRCYQRELSVFPDLRGKVIVRFTLQTSGTLTNVAATENTTLNPTLPSCIEGVISSVRIEPGPEGGAVSFEYPFVFHPTNDAALPPFVFGPTEAATDDLGRRVQSQLYRAIARRRSDASHAARVCFVVAQRSNSAIQGGVIVAEVGVTPAGNARAPRVMSDSVGHPRLALCIAQAMSRLGRINPAPVGRARTFRFKFVFGNEVARL